LPAQAGPKPAAAAAKANPIAEFLAEFLIAVMRLILPVAPK
jgi:hypothetical protein